MGKRQKDLKESSQEEQNGAGCQAQTGESQVRKLLQSEVDFRPKVLKNRPRGKPWLPGVSGNPAGRPKGSKNKFTLSVLEGIRRAEEKLAQPRVLNREKPFQVDGNYCLQEGLWFAWDPILQEYVALPDQNPPPKPPARFDPGARRTEMTWKGRLIYVQHGWPFDPDTWRRLKI